MRAGNLPLKLHEWDADFAAWCSYKYLNSGPGGIAGCFVNERHARDTGLTRFAGWWGHDKESRFRMGPDFQAIASAEGWQLSNPSILALAALRASMDIFDEAGMESLTRKKRATDRIPGISLEAERFEPLSAGHFERSGTTRGAAFPANQHEWAKSLRPVSRGRNYLRLARARYHARRASATLQFIYGCVFFCGRIFPSDRFVAQRAGSSPAIRSRVNLPSAVSVSAISETMSK